MIMQLPQVVSLSVPVRKYDCSRKMVRTDGPALASLFLTAGRVTSVTPLADQVERQSSRILLLDVSLLRYLISSIVEDPN